tara:strand:- start:6108 stop:6974 length:867 start_codon:yes stop_codon:yes gene_type:complete
MIQEVEEEYSAVVLAGTHADKRKLEPFNGENKAFLDINNQPLVLYVLQALQNSQSISRIAVVGPKKKLEDIIPDPNGIKITDESLGPKESRRFIENAVNAYNLVSPNKEKTLFLPCDLPFILAQDIDDFILQTQKSKQIGFYYGMINVNKIPPSIEALKTSQKSFLKGKGYYRTAGLFLFDNANVNNRQYLESQIERVFPLRRTTSKLSKSILYGSLFWKFRKQLSKYFTHRLTQEELEGAIYDKIGLKFKLTEVQSPRAIIDIDTAAEDKFISTDFNDLKTSLAPRS